MTSRPDVTPGGPTEDTADAAVDPMAGAPEWVMPMIRRATWRVVSVVLIVSVLLIVMVRARSVVSMLVMALFFSIAMDPAVTWLHRRYGWRRGIATGAIFAGLALFVVTMIFVLIPALVTVSERLTEQLPTWLTGIESTFSIQIGDGQHNDVAAELGDALATWAQTSWKSILGLAGGVVGLVFQFFTIAMFDVLLRR